MRKYFTFWFIFFFIYIFSFESNAQTKTNEYKGIGFWALDYEKESGFEVDTSSYLLLDSIVNECKLIIKKKDIYSEKEIIDILTNIGMVLKKINIKYDTLDLLSESLIKKKLVCKFYTLIYLTIGECLQLPLYSINAPEHVFIIWKDNYNEIYWETTGNFQSSKDFYINEMKIPFERVKSGNFFNLFDYTKSKYIIYEYIGDLQFKIKKFDLCISNSNKALELNSKSSLSYNNRGFAYYSLGKINESIVDFTKAIDIDNHYATAYLNRGSAKYDLGKIPDAIKDFDLAIIFDPNLSQAYHNRGIARGVSGDDIGACQDMRKAACLGNKQAIEMYNNNCK